MNDDAILHAMQMFGGSFVRRLADLWQVADEENRARLAAAFPDYWDKYREIAELKKEEAHVTSPSD